MTDSIWPAVTRPDGSPWLDCSRTLEHADALAQGVPFENPCPACGDLLVLHGIRGCLACQIRGDMSQIGVGLQAAMDLAALDPDKSAILEAARAEGRPACPAGPDGRVCGLSEEGHRILRARYYDHPTIGQWGWLHTADVEIDVYRRGELITRAGDPIPLPFLWGDAHGSTASAHVSPPGT